MSIIINQNLQNVNHDCFYIQHRNKATISLATQNIKPQESLATRSAGALDDQTQALLSVLHAGGAVRFLWTPNGGKEGNKKRSVWYPVDRPVIVPSAWADKNVYFGVNPSAVQREYYEASTNETIAAVNCLFAEFDGADFTNPSQEERDAALAQIMTANPKKSVLTAMNEAHTLAKKSKFSTDIAGYKALAKAHVESLNPAPSATWDSGGGYQCVWLLDKTFTIPNKEDREQAIALQAAWVQFVGGDPGAKDLRRVLRLPGTTNRKKHFAPDYPTVHFIKFDLDQRYSLDDLAARLPAPAPASTPTAPTVAPEALAPAPYAGDSVIRAYNARHIYKALAISYGYTDAGSNRLSRPGQPESAGVELDSEGNRGRHWSGNDEMHDPHWRRPFDLFCHFEHAGDVKAAVKAAAALLGLGHKAEKPTHVIDRTTGEIIPLADLMEFCRREIAERMAGMKDTQINVALAIVQIFENAGTIEAPLSDRYLSGLGAVTHQTANHALKGSVIYTKEVLADGTTKRTPSGRKANGLDQWLVTRVSRGNGILSDTYQLSATMIAAYRDESSTRGCSTEVTASLWMIRRGVLATIERNVVDDAFTRNSVKKTVKRKPQIMSDQAQADHLTEMMNAADRAIETNNDGDQKLAHRLVQLMAHGQNEADIKRLDSLSTLMNGAADEQAKRLKSFTTSGLRVIAALTEQNGLSISELAEATNRHESVIGATVKRLARNRIQETVIQPLVRVVKFGASKRVFLYKTWEDRLASIRLLMHTDGLLKARQIGYANQRIRRIDKILPGVRKAETRELYLEIRARTKRMIEAIEGKRTAKEAAQLLHQEIKHEAPRPLDSEVLAVPAPAQAAAAPEQELASQPALLVVDDMAKRKGNFYVPFQQTFKTDSRFEVYR